MDELRVRLVRIRVVRDGLGQLRAGQDDDAAGDSQLGLDRLLEVAGELRVGSAVPADAVNTTLPLAMYVATSVWPSDSTSVRSAGIATRLCGPRLIPRNRATWVGMRPLWSHVAGAGGGTIPTAQRGGPGPSCPGAPETVTTLHNGRATPAGPDGGSDALSPSQPCRSIRPVRSDESNTLR